MSESVHRSCASGATIADLAALLDNTTDFIWSLDTDCRLVYGNLAFSAAMKRVLGRPLMPGDSLLDPAFSAARCQEWRTFYMRALAGETFFIEQPISCVASSPVREYRFFPLVDDAGEIIGASVHSRDISERQQAEEEMHRSEALLNQAQSIGRIGSYVWDLRDDTLQWSRSMYELAGIDPETFEGKLSEVIATHIHPADRADVLRQIEQMIAERRAHAMEFRLVRPDGRTVWLRSTARFEVDEQGALIRAIGVHYDVTAEHRSQQLLNTRLHVSRFATTHTLDELLQEMLDQAELLTESTISFFHFLDNDQNSLRLQTWSTNTLRNMCTAVGERRHYPLDAAGVWVECVRQRKPLLYNDYASLPNRRGLPEGHADVKRMMTVPIMRNDEIVAIVGVGNKAFDYEAEELEVFARYADSVWDSIQVKRVEDALWQSREIYRAVVENSTDSIVRCDVNGKFLFGNEAAIKLLGGAEAAPIGKTPEKLGFCPAFRHTWDASLQYVVAQGFPASFEFDMEIAGRTQTLDMRFSPEYSPTGRVVSVLGVARDITERKIAERELARREEQYRVLTETMKDVVWVLDIESSKFRYVSPSVYALRGYTSEEVVALPVDHAMTPEDRAALKALTLDRVAEFESGSLAADHFYVDQFPQPCKDGSVVWTEVVSNYYINPDNQRLELRGVTRDITERRQAEVALRQARDTLEQRVEERTRDLTRVNAELAAAMQVKDEFLSVMSHELRTPLNAILIMSQVMLEGVRGSLNERQLRAMQTITESGQHLLAMINDILDITSVQAGTVVLDRALHEVDALCAPLIDRLRAEAATRSQSIDYVCPSEPLYLWADGRRFGQIVRHLLENAMKFTPDGGQISLFVQPDLDRRVLSVRIEDNGIGIAHDAIERIFQPFTQADSALSRQFGGSGIGLTLVRHLVELHGGTITAESAGMPGSGSRFTVQLPWQAPPVGSPHGAILAAGAVHGPHVVLIADDNPSAQRVMGDALRAAGYEVLAALDGIEAVATARLRPPDLILMDMQMPRCDGATAIRRLRQLPACAATPIVAMSSVVVPNDRALCLDAGADDYLAKPISADTVVDVVARHLAPGRSLIDAASGADARPS